MGLQTSEKSSIVSCLTRFKAQIATSWAFMALSHA